MPEGLRNLWPDETRQRYDALIASGKTPQEALQILFQESEGQDEAKIAKQAIDEATKVEGTPEDPGPDNILQTVSDALPNQKTDLGDRVLQALQVFGEIGGGIAADRATRRADRETGRRQSTANLINTLRGRAVASGTPATPRLGMGGRALQGIGKLAAAGSDLRNTGRQMEQSKFDNLATLMGLETAQTQASTAAAREDRLLDESLKLDDPGEDGLTISDAGIRDALEGIGQGLYSNNPNATRDQIAEETAKLLQGIGVEEDLILIYTGSTLKGFGNAKTTGARLDDADARIQAGIDRLDEAIKGRQSDEKRTVINDLSDSVYEKTRERIIVGRQAPRFLELYLPLLDDFGTIQKMKEVPKGEERLFFRNIEKEFNRALTESHQELTKAGGLSNQARMNKADIQALGEKIDHLEQLRDGTEVSGPLSVLVPTLQLFMPNSFAYDNIQMAFALEVASILNRGRPSDKDMVAAMQLVPSRDDSEAVAKIKFNTLRQMMLNAAGAIDANFPMPMSVFDTGKTEEIDGVSIPIYDFTQVGSMLENDRASNELIAKWKEHLKDGTEAQKFEAKAMLEKYGILQEQGVLNVGDEF